MVILKKPDEEKRRFIFLQESAKNKTIEQIEDKVDCGKATVSQLKTSCEKYLSI